MSKKEDLWGRFSGRMFPSPRTGFTPQQNTHTHTYHPIPTHTTTLTRTHTHTHPLPQPLSLTAGRTSETRLAHVALLSSHMEED